MENFTAHSILTGLALFLAGILLLLILFGMFKQRIPALNISFMPSDASQTFRVKSHPVISFFKPIAVIFFCIALLDPHYFIKRPNSLIEVEKEGIALYLLVDQSGSMNEVIETFSATGARLKISKMDLLKKTATEFVRALAPNDFIGLVGFARMPTILVPLTDDHSFVEEKINNLVLRTKPEENGTAIGYAIYKTVRSIIATRYYARGSNDKIKNTAIIVMTDGFQDPNPLDASDPFRAIGLIAAGEEAAKEGIPVYLINVDPRFGLQEFSPHRNQLQKMAELTGGAFYLASDERTLKSILTNIQQLHHGPLPEDAIISKELKPQEFERISFYPYLIAVGAFFLFLSFLCKNTFWRVYP